MYDLTPAELAEHRAAYDLFLAEHGPDADGETCDFVDYLAAELWLRGERVAVAVAVVADIPL